MKTLLFLLIAIIPLKWGTDLENAKKTAHEKNELILLNFSGSDWCAPCIQTRKEYFESEAFTKFAGDNLVLVNADFPRKKKNQLSPEQTKKNEALADKYNKEGNFPLTILMDADGKVIKAWKGKPEAPVEKWVAELKSICQARKAKN
jgi:thioredoxin-related protein